MMSIVMEVRKETTYSLEIQIDSKQIIEINRGNHILPTDQGKINMQIRGHVTRGNVTHHLR
jgi:hypothetical protein